MRDDGVLEVVIFAAHLWAQDLAGVLAHKGAAVVARDGAGGIEDLCDGGHGFRGVEEGDAGLEHEGDGVAGVDVLDEVVEPLFAGGLGEVIADGGVEGAGHGEGCGGCLACEEVQWFGMLGAGMALFE